WFTVGVRQKSGITRTLSRRPSCLRYRITRISTPVAQRSGCSCHRSHTRNREEGLVASSNSKPIQLTILPAQRGQQRPMVGRPAGRMPNETGRGIALTVAVDLLLQPAEQALEATTGEIRLQARQVGGRLGEQLGR